MERAPSEFREFISRDHRARWPESTATGLPRYDSSRNEKT